MKTVSTIPETIDEYISAFPSEIQALLEKMRLTIRKAAPHASEKICYRMPTFYLNGNLVHFAAFKHHIGFYPAPSGIDAFQDELGKYKTSKGAIQFPLDEPLPLKLVEAIVRFRVQENTNKISKKSQN